MRNGMNYVHVECLSGQPGESRFVAVPVPYINQPGIHLDRNGYYSFESASRVVLIPFAFIPNK